MEKGNSHLVLNLTQPANIEYVREYKEVHEVLASVTSLAVSDMRGILCYCTQESSGDRVKNYVNGKCTKHFVRLKLNNLE